MDINILKYFIIGFAILFAFIIVAYIILRKKMNKSEYRQMKKLQEGTKADTFSLEILYQRLYLTYIKTPFIKRYIYKLRRRLEILNIDDEYTTRKDSARILTNAILILIPVTLITILITTIINIKIIVIIIVTIWLIVTNNR